MSWTWLDGFASRIVPARPRLTGLPADRRARALDEPRSPSAPMIDNHRVCLPPERDRPVQFEPVCHHA